MKIIYSFILTFISVAGQSQMPSDTFILSSLNGDISINNIIINNTNDSIITSKFGIQTNKLDKSFKGVYGKYPTQGLIINNKYYLTFYYTNHAKNSSLQYIEIGYSQKNSSKLGYTSIRGNSFNNLKTNNGVHLGMNVEELSKALNEVIFSNIWYTDNGYWVLEYDINNKQYTEKDTSKIDIRELSLYQSDINTHTKPKFMVRYIVNNKQPTYKARYIIKDGILIKFGFGILDTHPTETLQNILY